MPPAPPVLLARVPVRLTTIPAAKEELEPLLGAWAAEIELRSGYAIEFEYRGAWLRAKGFEPDGQHCEYVAAIGGAVAVNSRMTSLSPPLSAWFVSEPNFVRMLREQWRQVRDGSARILDRAYFCLTAIKDRYADEGGAASSLQVSQGVLDKIGLLAAAQDPAVARKVAARGPAILTSEDRSWLGKALPRLILRCAERELGIEGLDVLTVDSIVAA